MAIMESDLDEIFRYHAPSAEQFERYQAVRDAAKKFAGAILENTLPSPDQTSAIRKVREAVMTANAAIALKGRF